jgi:AMMECR1 domain-containing protein
MNIYASYLISGIFDLPQDPKWKSMIKIPNKVFGVFVTVERKNQIHGCIGHWDNNYNNISDSILLEKMTSVGKSAVFEDQRSRILSPILEDPNADFTISWMLNPVYPVARESGYIDKVNQKFNNEEYGLIVVGKNNRRATFLPNVFSSIPSWEYILQMILEKANIGSSNYQLFAYRTIEYGFKFFQSFGEQFIPAYYNFLIKHNRIPYMVKKSGKIIYDDNQWVRNMAVIEGMRELPYQSYYVDTLSKQFEKFIKSLLSSSDRDSDHDFQSRQSLTSLIEIVSDEKKQDICQYFDLKIDDLEPNFERPQVFISILRNCKKKKKIRTLIEKMLGESNRDVFRLNWDAQVVMEASKIWKSFHIYAYQIDRELYPILESFDQNTMTNELAVGFECVCSLLATIKNNISCWKFLMKIILLLWGRWDPIRGLYRFLEGDERIDITNHVIHGQKLLNDNPSYSH